MGVANYPETLYEQGEQCAGVLWIMQCMVEGVRVWLKNMG